MHPVELIFGNEMDFFFATVLVCVRVCVRECVVHVNCECSIHSGSHCNCALFHVINFDWLPGQAANGLFNSTGQRAEEEYCGGGRVSLLWVAH